jgi:D-alanyl-lipoteichoic acid acyltransferase DltB (MBOAT superfamily)
MISFSMDRYWALHNSNLIYDEFGNPSSKLDEKKRVETSHICKEYNIFNYLMYVCYAPLLLAGPIISFNDFVHQVRQKPSTVTLKSVVMYAVRWGFALFCMEAMMHLFYAVAIKDAKAWNNFGPLELFQFSLLTLFFIWLKLLVIWRFFRLWALSDGIETVENMQRCMLMNYSAVTFWKTWHSSYNKWLIRYIYIPLGGKKWKIANMFAVFTFVSLWHDPKGELLAWGWLVPLFILPETGFSKLMCSGLVLNF